jgi:Tfp pilus assembly protein PilF
VALALAGCGHSAKSPGAAANPIAPVVLPKTNAEAQAAFDEGVRLMKMGKKHYKEARKPLQRATELDGRLFEAWHDLGVIETSLGNFDKAVDDFERALSIQPGARKTLLAYGESLRRAPPPEEGGVRVFEVADSDPNDFEMRARYGQVLREAGRSTSRWNRPGCFWNRR